MRAAPDGKYRSAEADVRRLPVRRGRRPGRFDSSAGDGSYELPLPSPGRYVLSVAEASGATHTRLILLPAADTEVDVELGGDPPSTILRV
ncbi:hypothetical protein [Arthrobacter caoxuetaonis]|uniref:Uncharacterized protein n=1 Tax=Arthrobacter caoxuetaonis TaxID=2886935 RepID=A0A9X1SFU6_9MICC|nr:hypothetical protein [Arthrobacter caoxuetaonis]MCC3298889.1 hypothetical protein [Arthrobacter caoxuetaonis]